MKPLKIAQVNFLTHKLIIFSWILSSICCLPQLFVWELAHHPNNTNYIQCISLKLDTTERKIAYNIFFSSTSYMLPLIVMCFCYVKIFYAIATHTKSDNRTGNQMYRNSCGGGGTLSPASSTASLHLNAHKLNLLDENEESLVNKSIIVNNKIKNDKNKKKTWTRDSRYSSYLNRDTNLTSIDCAGNDLLKSYFFSKYFSSKRLSILNLFFK